MGFCGWACVALCVLQIVVITWWHIGWRRLAAERRGENFDTFRASFDSGTPEELLRVVYALCQSWTSVADFPVRADDDLAKVYSREEFDFEDAVHDLLKMFGRVSPPPSDHPFLLATVRDFVKFVIECPPALGE